MILFKRFFKKEEPEKITASLLQKLYQERCDLLEKVKEKREKTKIKKLAVFEVYKEFILQELDGIIKEDDINFVVIENGAFHFLTVKHNDSSFDLCLDNYMEIVCTDFRISACRLFDFIIKLKEKKEI